VTVDPSRLLRVVGKRITHLTKRVADNPNRNMSYDVEERICLIALVQQWVAVSGFVVPKDLLEQFPWININESEQPTSGNGTKQFVRPPGHHCGASTGICDSITFGTGELDENGYFEHPCPVCARAFEKQFPDKGPCWPFL